MNVMQQDAMIQYYKFYQIIRGHTPGDNILCSLPWESKINSCFYFMNSNIFSFLEENINRILKQFVFAFR
jgi:hypothetical protein